MTTPEPTMARPARGGGRGQICSWPGGVLWIGTSDYPGSVHAHHAIQLGFGDDEPLHFRTAEDAPWLPYAGSIIPADMPHALDGSGRGSAIVFVEPESAEGVGLRSRTVPGSIAHLPEDEARAAARRIFGAWVDLRAGDTFGRTVIEALAVGRPLLGWAHGGTGELLAQLQPEGAVAPFEEALLAQRASAFLARPPTPPAAMPYTLQTMQDATLALYRSLVAA